MDCSGKLLTLQLPCLPRDKETFCPAPTESCMQRGHICMGEPHHGASPSSQSPLLPCEAPAESFPAGFLGMQDLTVTHFLLMSGCHLCEAPAISDPWGGTAAERGRDGATRTTRAAAKDHEVEVERVGLLLSVLAGQQRAQGELV